MNPDPQQILQERITELEIQLELESDRLRVLNDVVTEQGREIDTLRRELRKIREHLVGGGSDDPQAPNEEPPPPHY